jgi:U32 family peptidase
MWVDDEYKSLEGARYLFSPKDLCGIEEVPALAQMGVESLKIEGRLKTPAYVAATVQSYKKQSAQELKTVEQIQEAKDLLGSTYSRGFYSGWLNGVAHQHLADGLNSAHRGLKIGVVSQVNGLRVYLDRDLAESACELELGDGVLLRSPTEERQVGSRIFAVGQNYIDLSKDIDLKIVQRDWVVYLNDRPQIEKQLGRTHSEKSLWKRIPLWAKMEAKLGQPLCLSLEDDLGHWVQITSSEVCEKAQKNGATPESVLEEISGLSNTAYKINAFECDLDEGLFIPSKRVRTLRQEATAALDQKRIEREVKEIQDFIPRPAVERPCVGYDQAKLHVLLRHEYQIEFLQGQNIDTVYLDLEFGKDYKRGIERIRDLGFKAGISTLRVYKPGEWGHLRVIQALEPDVILVRNLGAWKILKEWLIAKNLNIPLVADHSLNVTNSLSAEWFLKDRFDRILPSYDLNYKQLVEMLQKSAGEFEVNIHHYMPTFHMEHCVFAAFLSSGNSVKDCGKVCEHHKVELRDHTGAKHFLKSDQECRNTLFHGTPQSAVKLVPELMAMGVAHFRVECLYEDEIQMRTKIEAYSALLSGQISATECFERVGVVEKYGIAEGQLFNEKVWVDRKKEE